MISALINSCLNVLALSPTLSGWAEVAFGFPDGLTGPLNDRKRVAHTLSNIGCLTFFRSPASSYSSSASDERQCSFQS